MRIDGCVTELGPHRELFIELGCSEGQGMISL